MASPASGPSASSTTASSIKATADPILRNALRYTISAREYALLHRYVLSRSRVLKKRVPSVETVQRVYNPSRPGTNKGKGKDTTAAPDDTPAGAVGGDDYNARAIRHSVRVFVATAAVTKLWDIVSRRLMAKKQDANTAQKNRPLTQSPTLRLSLSLSTILLLYRILFRFLTRLRSHLLDPSALPFRLRNPRTSSTLTSPYAPAVGASLAGLALGIYPAQQLRVSIAIYAMFRALEFGYSAVEDSGALWGWEKGPGGKLVRSARPAWWGSWMLQPFAMGQLLHAVVFDRDCFPMSFGDFIFNNSSAYIHAKPADFPATLKWPGTYDIVDSLAQMARLHWPPFISPTLFPTKEDAIPLSLSAISPMASGAHPLITSLSCATLHPSDPSCSRTALTFWLRSFPPLTRLALLVYSALLLPRFTRFYHFPLSTLNSLVTRALRTSTFVTGSISTIWSSLCFFQTWFPRSFLPTQRFFLSGFLAGFWAWVERKSGRGVFIYTARASVDSLWKVGVKRRWWRAMKGGDVWLFVLALMVTGVVYERDARAVREGEWRKGVSWARGEGWRDWGIEDDGEEEEGEKED
ncbi:hypothetical protein GE09DRAFT_728734 [Coniochaeta sp. 2T2.1]|nr:hypothetical protein GE09DRAFT_728734 [Coniochaeta sp. 2T2.1]